MVQWHGVQDSRANLRLLYRQDTHKNESVRTFPPMPVERTYTMVKPDGVQRRLTGEIIRRFENRGLTLVGLKLLVPTREVAEKHYEVHCERPFFGDLVNFVTSGPVV